MALIKKLREFIGLHKGEKIVVCGCGVSLLEFKDSSSKYITIGVNDVPALFQPTYLLATDPPSRFLSDSRRKLVNESSAKHLFTCAKGWRHKSLVHFDIGTKYLHNLKSSDKIDHFVTSPYVAVCLAYKLGAKHIGMIGVDFTNGHFYNPQDGPHPVIRTNYLNKVNTAFSTLRQELEKLGTSFYNLSPISKVEIPKITLEEFNKL